MSILRSNFLPVGKCDGGTEGRPSWAPNRSGRIGPVVGARHGVPPTSRLSGWLLLRGRVLDAPPFLPFQGVEAMRRSAEKGKDPSPASPRQVGTPAASHPLPRGEGNDAWGARERLISPTFSHGEKVDRDGRSLQPSRAG